MIVIRSLKTPMRNRIFSTILFALSLILTIGIKTFFSGCGPKEDGSWMLCHWTEQTVFILGICLSIIFLIALIFGGKKTAIGASLSAIPVAIITAITPGILMPLCKMPIMQCHILMCPATIIISSIITLVAIVNTIFIFKSIKKGENA